MDQARDNLVLQLLKVDTEYERQGILHKLQAYDAARSVVQVSTQQ